MFDHFIEKVMTLISPSDSWNIPTQIQIMCSPQTDQTSVATLEGHLCSNVCSKFHKNRGIFKSILRNHDMGVFFTWNFVNPPKKEVYFELYTEWFGIVFNEPVIVQYTMMLERVFLYYELVNIYKYVEELPFKHFSCFLKNKGLLKSFVFFFLISEKKGCFKELKISWFHR